MNWKRTSLGMKCHLVVRIIVDTFDDIHFSGLVPDGQHILRTALSEKANHIWPIAISQQPILEGRFSMRSEEGAL